MKKLFKSEYKYLKINKDEEIEIEGNYNDFDFTLQLRSEFFDAWIPQDMSYLMKKYPETHEKLLKRVEQYLLDQGDTDVLMKGYGN